MRMGFDKALVHIDGVAMVVRVREALVAAGAETVAAVGGDSAALEALGIDVVPDPRQGLGPLAGIVAALDWARAGGVGTVVVVATDLPWLDPELLTTLAHRCAADGRVAVAVATGSRREPLVAAWPTAVSEIVSTALDGGARAVHQVLAVLDPVEVEVDRPQQLANLNTPDQLAWRPDQ